MQEIWWLCPILFAISKVTYSNADFYTSTKLLSFSDSGTCKYSGTSFYFSPTQWFHTNIINFFLVPMKCPHKQHTTVLYAMSHTVSFYFITCSELLVLTNRTPRMIISELQVSNKHDVLGMYSTSNLTIMVHMKCSHRKTKGGMEVVW